MKTKITGIVAILLALCLSSFTAPKKHGKFGTGPYWFFITDGIPKGGHPVPADYATFIQQSSVAPDESAACPGGSNQCLSGFDASQVDTMTDELKDDNEVSVHQQEFQE